MIKSEGEKKVWWAKVFLWSVGGYYLIILNQHFNIPLRLIPWALIFLGLMVVFCANDGLDYLTKNIRLIYSLPGMPIVLISLSILILGFLASSINDLPEEKSLNDVSTVFLGPIFLGLIAPLVFPRRELTIQYLCAFCAYAIVFLAFTDTLHYVRDWYRLGRFADDSSHRWFGDGYIFFIPWLLLAYIKAETRFKQFLWLIGIFWIFLLLSGTGSRGVMIVILIEITLFMSFYRRRPKAFLLPFILTAAFGLGAIVLAPQQIAGAIQRGALVQNRIYDAWLPVLDFIEKSPWMGHGFGPNPWNKAYAVFLNSHPGWPGINYGGPHNLMLDVAFIGGILSLLAFICLCFWIALLLFRMVRQAPFEIAGPALATLCSFIDFYMVRGLVESCRWEPLGITLTWVLLLSILNNQSNSSVP